tara:strand:+ start:65 stop:448 length:384 start_codon:yes stop_codon:yes gene_type:complete
MGTIHGVSVTTIKIEILKILRDKKVHELHEVAEKIAKRTNAKRVNEGYNSPTQHDSKWIKRVKFELWALKEIELIKNPKKVAYTKKQIKELNFGGTKGKFIITDIGIEVLKLCISYKKQEQVDGSKL